MAELILPLIRPTPLEAYNFIRGIRSNGTTYIDPSGVPRFSLLDGDPVSGTGWNDSGPQDRRTVMSSGPLNLAPDESVEILTAVIVGQGD